MTLKTFLFNKFRRLLLHPRLEPWLINFVAGCDIGSWRAKCLPNHYQYPRGSYRRARRENIEYELDISHLVDWFIYFGLAETSKARAFSQVRPGDVVIDVGANIGEFLMNFAVRAGNNGRVYGFEPDERNYSLCARNVALNSLANIRLEPLALAHERREFSFTRLDPLNPGTNRIAAGGENTIVGLPMDEYVAREKIDRVNFIKIDVEGFETNVLRGARETISKHKPILFLELDDSNLVAQNSSAREILTLLSEFGYTVTDAQTGKKLQTEEYLEKKSHTDILCEPLR